ncbi:hypothetical protein EMCRGX_G021606, partial [Ephydatia muelleri]
CGSYLSIPRLTFTGRVRIDINSVNNFICNFDLDEPIKYGEQFDDFNPNGTGEFSFFDCFVTSALSSSAGSSIPDAVMNNKVVNNLNETYPKLVDIDVGYQRATVYGLTLAIVNSDGNIVLQGRLEPMMISQDMWARHVCVPGIAAGLSGQSVSILTNVKWGDTSGSPTLRDLQVESAKQGGNLSISLTIHSYTFDNDSRNFSLGYVIGAIGIAEIDEPMQFAGDRILSYENVKQLDIQMNTSDECFHFLSQGNDHPTWMYKAPFQISHNNRLTVDLSNSISLNEHGNFIDIGNLWLGVKNPKNDCIHVIGDHIPYLQVGWVPAGCIVDQILSTDELQLLSLSQLVIVRTTEDPRLLTPKNEHQPITSLPVVSCEDKSSYLQLMLQEVPVFIRPIDFYHGRLEYNETISIRIKVTQYGKPMENQTVQIHHLRSRETFPRRGIVPMSYYATTNSQGLATFIFQVVKRIPFPRRYRQPVPPCNKTELPIDGYNQEIYQKIHSVVIQEMQHVAQVANILLAIGGRPVLDSNTTAPQYPTLGLPGGVLPHLHVNIEKFSKEQVYKLFMVIEMPHNLSVATNNSVIFNNTIGQFYTEIKDCIGFLGDSVFIQNRKAKQLIWPAVNVVTDVPTANTAIDIITHQGEGAAPIDPRQASKGSPNELAHFYEFEEIVCQRHLISDDQKTYCYSGDPISFDPSGVWPMQPNPSKDKIKYDSNCYVEVKAFHGAYRSLLRKLQDIFDGDAHGMTDAIAMMKSLSTHGRKVMWTKIMEGESEGNDTTCGPMWDYDW